MIINEDFIGFLLSTPLYRGSLDVCIIIKKSLEDLGHSVDVLSHTPDTTKYRIIGQEPEIEIDNISPYIKEKIVTEMPSLPINSWIYNVEIFRYSLEL